MCGVVGFIGRSGAKPERIAAVRNGLRAILHRGREEVGLYDDDTATLGAVRLSIVDLLLGKQPMMTADGRYVLGFNGEIFNYLELRDELLAEGVRFATRSDTEVLLYSLAHWGVDEALGRLNGQFGFAFYDRRTRKMVLGRDPFGERPMYYAPQAGVCFFASEVKGLFAFPQVRRELSPPNLLAAARFWSPVPDETCFSGVRCLPQGHIARIGLDGSVDVIPYYSGFEAGRTDFSKCDMTFNEAVEELRELLTASVRLRLRGDYEVGAAISGGLDSAIIASIMKDLTGEAFQTFSIRVPESRLDEGPQQEVVTTKLGTRHSSILVTPADIRERFPKVVEQCEMPLHRAAPVACSMLAEHIGQAGVRIVLGGEGADEQFLGYDITKEAAFLSAEGELSATGNAGASLVAALHDTRHTSQIGGDDILRFHAERQHPFVHLFGAHLRRFDGEPLQWLRTVERGEENADVRLLNWVEGHAPQFRRWTAVSRAQWLDMHTFFIGYGMTCHGDRAGAGFNVETRFPFLDPNVTAFAARLPQDWKLKALRREKHILREAYAHSLPDEITNRRKFGMRIPGAAALGRTRADDWVSALLNEDSLRRSTIVDAKAALQLVEQVEAYHGEVPYPDSHAYLHLLSTLLLEQTLVRDFRTPDVDIDAVFVKQIDGERAALADINV